jgi:hypothetical protein
VPSGLCVFRRYASKARYADTDAGSKLTALQPAIQGSRTKLWVAASTQVDERWRTSLLVVCRLYAGLRVAPTWVRLRAMMMSVLLRFSVWLRWGGTPCV